MNSNRTQMMQIQSEARDDKVIEVKIASTDIPVLRESDVLVRIEAAPINPSDLGLLFGPADMDKAQYLEDAEVSSIEAPIPSDLMPGVEGRINQSLSVGNEGAGIVVATGEAEAAQGRLGLPRPFICPTGPKCREGVPQGAL